MEKKTTPAVTVILYIIGIIFLIIAAFMLVTAINSTKVYLQSYDASFADMWSHSIQYVIAQCVPYLGIGVLCLGIGKAIKEMRNVSNASPVSGQPASDPAKAGSAASDKELSDKITFLSKQVETAREVLGIKIEEKEKRDSFRLAELGRKLGVSDDDMTHGDPVKETVTPAPDKEDAGDLPETASEPAGMTPEIMRHAGTMSMPAIPAAKEAETPEAEAPEAKAEAEVKAEAEAETEVKAEAAEGSVPDIMIEESNGMSMPAIPAVTDNEAAGAAEAPGPVPEIMRHAGTMSMPAIPEIKAQPEKMSFDAFE